MPKYTITDKDTGAVVVVESATPPRESDIPGLFEHAKTEATNKLHAGMFNVSSEGYRFDKSEKREAVKKLSAAAMGMSPNDVDVESGMDIWGRFRLDQRPDMESRAEWLGDKFGMENVSLLSVGGDSKLFYRNPKTSKMTMVDEMGSSLADWTADISSEVITGAGAVLGAGAAVLATGATGGLALPLIAAGGAAAGTFGTGLAQDVRSELVTGQDLNVGKHAKTRATEAAIGVPIDLATSGLGRLVSRWAAGKAADVAVAEVDRVWDIVNKSKAMTKAQKTVPKPGAVRTGKGSKVASEIASARPNSQLAKDLGSVRDGINDWKDLVTKGTVKSDRAWRETTEALQSNYKKVVDSVAVHDKAAANAIQEGISSKAAKILAPNQSRKSLGGKVKELLRPGVDKIKDTNKKNFADLDTIAGAEMVPIQPIVDSINQAVSKFEVLKDNASLAVARRLKKDMAEVPGSPLLIFGEFNQPLYSKGKPGKTHISFKQLREHLTQISDSVSRNKDAGYSSREQVASAVLEGLEPLRDSFVKQSPKLADAYDRAMVYYKDNLLNTKRSAVGRTLKEKLADSAITDVQSSELIVSDPDYIRQALEIAGQAGDGGLAARELKSTMQSIYLNKIGLTDSFVGGKIDFDPDVVKELWGTEMVKSLKNLQSRISQSVGVDSFKIKPEDVSELFSAFGKDKASITSNIVKRAQAEKKANSILNATLLRKLYPRKGLGDEWLEPDLNGFDLAKMSAEFIGATNSQTSKAMKALEEQGSKSAIKAFRQSYITNVFERFSTGAQADRFGNTLWNPIALEAAMKPGTTLRNNLNTVLGKKGAREVLAANRVLLEASSIHGPQVADIFQPRYSLASGGKINFYGVGNLVGGLRGRILSVAYGSDKMSKIMKFLVNPATDAETDAMLKELLPWLFTSSHALQSIAIQGTFDPSFPSELAEMYKASGEPANESPQQPRPSSAP